MLNLHCTHSLEIVYQRIKFLDKKQCIIIVLFVKASGKCYKDALVTLTYLLLLHDF